LFVDIRVASYAHREGDGFIVERQTYGDVNHRAANTGERQVSHDSVVR